MANQEVQEIKTDKQIGEGVVITYYTDPLCCWSWALEPHLRKLKDGFGEKINWRYCMGGLIPDWKNFDDPVNSVTRPLQMGPVWMHASQVSGMPMNHRIWMDDPPASSYPACIAVKAAELQSKEAGEKYLKICREACMVNGLNIAKKEVLERIAGEVAESIPSFDQGVFRGDLVNGRGMEAFRRDLLEVQSLKINRFPSLVFRREGQSSILLSGYQIYSSLKNALNRLYSHQVLKNE